MIRRLPLLLPGLLLALVAFAAAALDAGHVTVVTAKARHDFRVELAVTPQEQRVGLMFRRHLDEDAGMLFIYPRPERLAFWMKNTLIPLDMLFIDAQGRIVFIQARAEPQSERSIETPVPAKAVLEINGGLADRLGIAVGDRVEHPALR